MMIERRMAAGKAEIRTAGAVTQIVGHGAVFGIETVIGNNFRERIMPGAFRGVLSASPDVVSLFNHNPNLLLGRSTSGTLVLCEDETGLRYEVTPPESRADVLESVSRGDITGSSFGFRVKRDEWMKPTRAGELPLRTIHEFETLQDVGPVTFPAYSEASAEARDMAMSLLTEVPSDAQEQETEQRAGRVLSAANEKNLKQARDLIDGVVKQVNEQKSAVVTGEQRQDGETNEDSAELVQYQTLDVLLTQADTALSTAREHVQALIADESELPAEPPAEEVAEEELESARLMALLALCAQICGACNGAAQLAQALLDEDETETPSDPMAMSRAAGAVADADRNRRLRLASACR